MPAAASIGYNPQFGEPQIVVEARILNVDAGIYGEAIDLDLVARVREERRFERVDALAAQMGRDVKQVRALLGGGSDQVVVRGYACTPHGGRAPMGRH